MQYLRFLDEAQLRRVCGGDDIPMGPTVLVAGRPQSRSALIARGDKLFARAYDATIADDDWLREWRKLNKAWHQLPLSAEEQNQ